MMYGAVRVVPRYTLPPVHGILPEVERMIEEGADPSDSDNDGFTPLHFAAQTRNARLKWPGYSWMRVPMWTFRTASGTRRCLLQYSIHATAER